MSQKEYKMEDWVYHLMGKGSLTFSLQTAREAFPGHSDQAVQFALFRLAKKGKILSIHKGFYLIIYPQYQSKGILPPNLFIDDLMKHLKRDYYVGLLSAAAIHGAAHQSPQEFFVFTTKPEMRPLQKKGIRINFISISKIKHEFLEDKKNSSGYIKVSSPILTAIDLVNFDYAVGWLNRVCTVLNELCEEIKPSDFTRGILQDAPLSALQRLGYILESVVKQSELADSLREVIVSSGIKLQKIKLYTRGKKTGYPIDETWKVIINTEIETDEL